MTADENTSELPPRSGGKEADAAEADPKLLETSFLPPSDTATGRPLSTPPVSDGWIGRTLGKYQITETLGQGGMGIVFRAHDPMIERDVAIKLLPEELAEDERALSRFLAEAKAAGRLNHPNVVSIYEIGQEGEAYFLVMELLTGGSISAGLDHQRAFSVLDATRIVIDACKGLAAAHEVGLIHRDIKPANLLKAADGSIKITDFGLAKTVSSRTRELTQAGTVVGTPYFMSPEQCDGRAVDARSDLYSLGATYYSLLTGKNPYEGSDSVLQIMFQHCRGEIPDPRSENRSVPKACSAIIERAMAKAPEDRYPSADEMLADLQAVAATLSGEVPIDLPSQSAPAPVLAAFEAAAALLPPEPTRRIWLGALIGAIVTLLVGSIWLSAVVWRQPDPVAAPQPAAAVVVPPPEPIKVGVLHSTSGTMAGSESVVVDATLLAIEEINAAGGLHGRQIAPVVLDGRSDPATFASQAERLILEERVVTIFGCWTSDSRKAVKVEVEEHDHLLVYPLQYEGVEESPNIIYVGATPNQQIIPAVDWAMTALNRKRFFLVGSDYVFPRVANAIISDFLASKGGEVVGEVYLPRGTQNMTAVVEEIAAAKPDMILNTINGDSNTAFFRGLREAGITPTIVPSMSFSVAEQELRSLDISTMQDDYAAWTYFQAVDSPENAAFLQRFQAKFPQHVVSDPMESAYVGVKLWAQAVAEIDSVEPAKIRRAMLTQRLSAPAGPIRIDADTQHSFKTPMVGQIREDGQFEIIWAAPAPVRPQPFPATRPAADWKAFLHDLYTGWDNRWSAP